MKIQTFSIVVGTKACDAHCNFCVSHTTGFSELPKNRSINTPRFLKAVQLAKMSGCTTVLFTGKGEPTLYPEEITDYLERLVEYRNYAYNINISSFPLIELQTNGIRIGNGEIGSDTLRAWKLLNLNTIGLSVVGVTNEQNKKIYLHHRDIEYPDLAQTVDIINNAGFSTRLCLMMHKGIVDSPEKLLNAIQWAKSHGVTQMTVRPIRRPSVVDPNGTGTVKYINDNGLSDEEVDTIRNFVASKGTHIMTLMNGAHEARVYDVDGQNVCMSDCLTVEPSGDDIRTLIYYSDGKLCYDWAYKGARIL